MLRYPSRPGTSVESFREAYGFLGYGNIVITRALRQAEKLVAEYSGFTLDPLLEGDSGLLTYIYFPGGLGRRFGEMALPFAISGFPRLPNGSWDPSVVQYDRTANPSTTRTKFFSLGSFTVGAASNFDNADRVSITNDGHSLELTPPNHASIDYWEILGVPRDLRVLFVPAPASPSDTLPVSNCVGQVWYVGGVTQWGGHNRNWNLDTGAWNFPVSGGKVSRGSTFSKTDSPLGYQVVYSMLYSHQATLDYYVPTLARVLLSDPLATVENSAGGSISGPTRSSAVQAILSEITGLGGISIA